MHRNPPQLVDERLLRVMAHATRMHAISVLTDRTASPAELAEELKCPIRQVSYHLGVLEELGIVELAWIDEEAAGGRSHKHYYRAVRRPWFDREAWKAIGGGESDLAGVTASVMGLISQDIATSILAGSFDGEENHISRTQLLLDRESYEELVSLLNDTLEQGIFSIRERAANRIDSETETVLTEVALIQFDMPMSKRRT